MDNLIDANLHFLRQASELVERLEDACYARCEPGFYNSSIGAHLRHCLEHYEAFVSGLPQGEIDYDARKRDGAVETETGAAGERIDFLTNTIGGLKDDRENATSGRVLKIRMDCGEVRDACDGWQTSTVGRELQFLVSHTVHHFAMIRSLCVSNDTEVCETFGVAPSTLRHRAMLEENST